jgi:hypothetical protein
MPNLKAISEVTVGISQSQVLGEPGVMPYGGVGAAPGPRAGSRETRRTRSTANLTREGCRRCCTPHGRLVRTFFLRLFHPSILRTVVCFSNCQLLASGRCLPLLVLRLSSFGAGHHDALPLSHAQAEAEARGRSNLKGPGLPLAGAAHAHWHRGSSCKPKTRVNRKPR